MCVAKACNGDRYPPPSSSVHRGLKALHEGDGRPFVEPPGLADPVGPDNVSSAAARPTAAVPTAAAAATSTGVTAGCPPTGDEEEINETNIGVVAAEVKALTAQVSRLEANLDRVLTALLGDTKARAAGAEKEDSGDGADGESREK